jgi:hypothetical protein
LYETLESMGMGFNRLDFVERGGGGEFTLWDHERHKRDRRDDFGKILSH